MAVWSYDGGHCEAQDNGGNGRMRCRTWQMPRAWRRPCRRRPRGTRRGRGHIQHLPCVVNNHFLPKKIDQVSISIITIIVITTLRRQQQCPVQRYKPQALTNRGGFPPGSTDLSIGCFFFSRRYAKCRDFVNLYLFVYVKIDLAKRYSSCDT